MTGRGSVWFGMRVMLYRRFEELGGSEVCAGDCEGFVDFEMEVSGLCSGPVG